MPAAPRRGKQEEAAADEELAEEELEGQWLLVVGGLDGAAALATTEVFGPALLLAEPGPCLGQPRWGCAAVALDGPRVLVVGGFDGRGYLDTTEVLDLKAWTSTPGPRLGTARAGCAAVRVDSRRVLVLGGYSLDTCEILDLASMAFTPGPRMRSARACCASLMLDEHRLLVAGGYDRLGCCASTEVLDLRRAPREDEWDEASPTSLEKARFWPGPSMSRPRGGCAAAALAGGGRVLFVGGFDGTDRLASSELLDLGNYAVPCTQRAPAVGEAVASREPGDRDAQLSGAPPAEQAAAADDAEAEEGAQASSVWRLLGGQHATVVDVAPEEAEERPGDAQAEPGTFRLRNPEGQESSWQRLEEYVFPPTNEMAWAPGPPLGARRSGSAVALFPAQQELEQRPRFVVLGGLDETPNQAQNTTELLDLVETAAFVPGTQLNARRAYCAAAVVTVLGKLGGRPAEPQPPGAPEGRR